ncbi:MAG TPA: tetratricopeptide repeat protein [Thermoanaerobaculia bacterium]|nr:tetratricopeptide repeat protein [Thermoanaerobaculia bacterium]
MSARLSWMLVVAVVAGMSPSIALAQGHGDHGVQGAAGDGYGDRLGTVAFPSSCAAAAQPSLERGLALLHHMTYDGAHAAFAAAAAADPGCSLAAWGQAMTVIHPLWSDPPSAEAFARGHQLAAAAQEKATTERERAYADAVAAYFAPGQGKDERPNLAAFAAAWEEVHERFPEDPEAATLHAVTLLGTADPSDKSYEKQKRAGAIAEGILAKMPDHPGAHHYTIHAYDWPPLAEQAIEAARGYGEIAPEVPHALHMPSHIFTRRGLWSESIAWNARSEAAAAEHRIDGAVSMHQLHALDYLAYAHLQRCQDGAAREAASRMAALEEPYHAHLATAYTLASVPARIALERQRWADAAALKPRTPAGFPWDRFPAVEAITHFARALGAARSGDGAAARAALARMEALRDQAAATSGYWADQVEIQRLAAQAWLDYGEGRRDEALATMRQAAEKEAGTEKHPVTPGEVLPARELLGDMLLEMGRHEEALAAYEAALERSPNRVNALWGAGRAAEALGRADAARRHYQALLDTCAEADAGVQAERLAHARQALAGG